MEYEVRATNLTRLDTMTRAYLECAEWAGLSEEDREALELSVRPLWDAPSQTQAFADCADFARDNASDLAHGSPERAGHDFWLTRNRHGAGFWDGDWPAEVGKRLTRAAHVYGTADVMYDADSETLTLY
jgi:hypothetical protein